jgi:hypothetical protein
VADAAGVAGKAGAVAGAVAGVAGMAGVGGGDRRGGRGGRPRRRRAAVACDAPERGAFRGCGDAGGEEGPDEHEQSMQGDRAQGVKELEARGERQRRATRRGFGAGCTLQLCALHTCRRL